MALYKIAVLLSSNRTGTMNPNATGVTYDFASHVFGSCYFTRSIFLSVSLGLPTDRPLGDVVRPFVRGHRGWRFAKPKKMASLKSFQSLSQSTTSGRLFKYTHLGSKPQTEPEMRPPGPLDIGDHFFHVDIIFYEINSNN